MFDPSLRKSKAADQLEPGDWLAPGTIRARPVEVLFAVDYPVGGGGSHVRLVVRELDGAPPFSPIVSGREEFELATEALLAEYRKTAERAQGIADLRQLADWLEQNPWAPMPNFFEAMAHLDERHLDGPSAADAFATVCEVAERLGAEVETRLDDRTQVRKRFGCTEYTLIAWHPAGRPTAPKPEPDPDPTGLSYSRADDGDDPTPVSPAHMPLHFGAMVDGDELVDETPSEAR